MCGLTEPLITIDVGFAKIRQQFLKQKVRPLHVRVERPIECRRVPLADRPQVGNPRIDEENVQLSKCPSDFPGNFPLIGLIPRVGLDDDYFA
jgi:hypothetical protein